MARRMWLILSTALTLGVLASAAYAQDGSQGAQKNWLDLFKSTGFVGILLERYIVSGLMSGAGK